MENFYIKRNKNVNKKAQFIIILPGIVSYKEMT